MAVLTPEYCRCWCQSVVVAGTKVTSESMKEVELMWLVVAVTVELCFHWLHSPTAVVMASRTRKQHFAPADL